MQWNDIAPNREESLAIWRGLRPVYPHGGEELGLLDKSDLDPSLNQVLIGPVDAWVTLTAQDQNHLSSTL